MGQPWDSVGPQFGWVLPSTGDGPALGTLLAPRPPTLELLAGVTRAAEAAGFDLVLVPTGHTNNHFGEQVGYVDSLVTTAALAPLTRRIRLLVAIRAGTVDAPACARMTATLDSFTDGRLMLNLVAGGAAIEMYGEEVGDADRYSRLAEFAQVLRALWTEERATFAGRHYRLADAYCWPKPSQPPPIYFAGSSQSTVEMTARHGECLLVPGMPLDRAAAMAASLRAEATDHPVRIGIHFYVVARQTRAEAVAATRRLLGQVHPEVRAALGGNEQMTDAQEWDEPGSTYWWGMRRLWSKASVALVGSYAEVSDTLGQYLAAGFSTFLISGFPAVEELERFAEHIMPALRSSSVR